MWLTSAAQMIATVRHAGTAALDAPSPPASGMNAATATVTGHAASNRVVTETDGRALTNGDMLALRGVRAGHISQTPSSVQTCANSSSRRKWSARGQCVEDKESQRAGAG